eukprot:scpid75855/ scgid26745/ 
MESATQRPLPQVITTSQPPPRSSLSGGAIAGIVIGCLIAAAAAATVLLMVIWKRRSSQKNSYDPNRASSVRAWSFRFSKEDRERSATEASTESGPHYYAKSAVNDASGEIEPVQDYAYAYINASNRPTVPFEKQTSDIGEHTYESSLTISGINVPEKPKANLSVVTLHPEERKHTSATYDSLSPDPSHLAKDLGSATIDGSDAASGDPERMAGSEHRSTAGQEEEQPEDSREARNSEYAANEYDDPMLHKVPLRSTMPTPVVADPDYLEPVD